MMLYTDPGRVHAALDRMTDFHAEFVRRLLEASPDVPQYVFFNDDLCTQRGPFFRPSMYEEFVLPRVKRVSDICHRHGRRFIQHCCGSVRDLMPLFIRAGIDLIHPVQPGAEGNDVRELRRKFGRFIVLFMGMNMQGFMRTAKPREVTDFYRRLADDFSDGGLVLNIWCMPDIPLENMLALRRAFVE